MVFLSDRGAGARERILMAAGQLFYARGINATGIDAVVHHAGVAKASLYNNFSGKDDLVAAYLEQMMELWREETSRIDLPHESHATRIAAIFTMLEKQVHSAAFHGCPFLSAAAEMPDNEVVHAVVSSYRAMLTGHLAKILNVPATSELVQRIVLLYDGAMISAKFTGRAEGIVVARALACQLAEAAEETA